MFKLLVQRPPLIPLLTPSRRLLSNQRRFLLPSSTFLSSPPLSTPVFSPSSSPAKLTLPLRPTNIFIQQPLHLLSSSRSTPLSNSNYAHSRLFSSSSGGNDHYDPRQGNSGGGRASSKQTREEVWNLEARLAVFEFQVRPSHDGEYDATEGKRIRPGDPLLRRWAREFVHDPEQLDANMYAEFEDTLTEFEERNGLFHFNPFSLSLSFSHFLSLTHTHLY